MVRWASLVLVLVGCSSGSGVAGAVDGAADVVVDDTAAVVVDYDTTAVDVAKQADANRADDAVADLGLPVDGRGEPTTDDVPFDLTLDAVDAAAPGSDVSGDRGMDLGVETPTDVGTLEVPATDVGALDGPTDVGRPDATTVDTSEPDVGNDAADAEPSDAGDPRDADACAAPSLLCSGACVDARFDRAHCGSCDRRCGDAERCAAGVCAAWTAPPTRLAGSYGTSCAIRDDRTVWC